MTSTDTTLRELRRWINNGYLADILLIIPPDAELSPHSPLTLDRRGKTPGIPTVDGWVGHAEWTRHDVSQETLVEWLRNLQGAPFSIGLKARTIHGCDVDTGSEEFARLVYDASLPFLTAYGYGIRVGKAPGFLFPFRPETPRPKARIVFVHEITGAKGAVERLGLGQQYVVEGDRFTGQPYQWFKDRCGVILPKCRPEARPAAPDTQVDEWWDLVPEALADNGWNILARKELRNGKRYTETSVVRRNGTDLFECAAKRRS